MRSTMQQRRSFGAGTIFFTGSKVHASSEVLTLRERTFVARLWRGVARSEQLAAGLRRLGVANGRGCATFGVNHQEHLEAYFAVPLMGAVLHTLDVRLFSDQLAHVIDHAEDKVIIADAMLAPALARVLNERQACKHVIVVGQGDTVVSRRDARLRGARRGRGRQDLTGPISRRPMLRPCATRAGPPGTPKASSTATDRSTCILWPSPRPRSSASRPRRQDPARRAPVPRQCLGCALRGMVGGLGPDPVQNSSSKARRSCGIIEAERPSLACSGSDDMDTGPAGTPARSTALTCPR